MSGIDSSAPASPDSALLVNFSVHSLPSTRDAALRRTVRGRWLMIAVLLVCAAPVVASYFTYFVLRPQARTNYSELIVPARPLPGSLPLADLAGLAVAPLSLRGQWLVVVVAGGACDARCERHLWLQRQLHEALGAEKDRVDKIWLVDDGVAPRRETLAAIAATNDARGVFAPAKVLRADRAALAGWLAPAPGQALEDHLYLVDPRGDWMMRVPVDADPATPEARPRQAAARGRRLGPAGAMSTTATVDLAPLLGVLAVGTAIALVPLAWFWRRSRGGAPALRLQAFAWFVLFLSFDLVLLGAFTRLSDSGLGCPDWPGCYGHASPIGASAHIAAAEAAVPTGAVTATKAWIEMLHRYAATAIGALVVVLAALAIRASRRSAGRIGSGWALWTLLWICVQGAFGALTVAWRLYPAIVTLHLIGGMALLALLAIQAERYAPRHLPLSAQLRTGLGRGRGTDGRTDRAWAPGSAATTPSSPAATSPRARDRGGPTWTSPRASCCVGRSAPAAMATCRSPRSPRSTWPIASAPSCCCRPSQRSPGFFCVPVRRRVPWALALLGLLAWQAASGLGNVLLGWPLAAAVAHTAGAAALVVVLTVLLVRSAPVRAAPSRVDAGTPALAS